MAQPPNFEPGSRLGSYEIVKELGRGGMGAVLLATDLDLDRDVAIKVLHPELSAKFENDVRFRREARMLSRLNHPNIVVVYAIGKAEAGAHYIVMEYAKGENLRHRLRQGPLEPALLSHVMEQICSAVDDAHQHGIVHRDLKPENIQLTRRANDPNFVKVFDFGLATDHNPELDPSDAQEPSSDARFMGTPGYVAPEQVTRSSIDARTDIYALGVVACELLTGRLPIQSDSALGFLYAHLNDAPVLPSRLRPNMGISKAIDTVIARALEKDPDARYQTVSAFARSLADALQRWSGPTSRPAAEPLANAMTLDSAALPSTGSTWSRPQSQDATLVTGSPLPDTPEEQTAPQLQSLVGDVHSTTRLMRRVCVLHIDLDVRFEGRGVAALDTSELMDCLDVMGARLHRAIASHQGISAGPLVSRQDVFFGLHDDESITQNEHAERAVDCALEIRSALAAFADDPTIPEPFELRFSLGLSYGRVFITHAGPGRTVVHGSPLRQAMAIATQAEPGDVHITHDVYRRIRGVFDCFAVKSTTLHGLDGTIRSVHKRKQLARRIRAAEIYGVSIEMQGREQELRELRSGLARARSTQKPQLMVVSGEPGLGKSRLVNELIKGIEELPDLFLYESGRCTAARSASPYEPFVEAIRARSRIQSNDSAERARIKLELYLRNFLELGEQENHAEESVALRTLLELFLGFAHDDSAHVNQVHGEEAQRAKLFDGIRSLYRRLSHVSDAPIVFVLEDFQWASAPTRSLLGHLLAWLDVPALFIAVTREPEPLIEELSSATANATPEALAEVPLAPLEAAPSEALIRHMLRRLVTLPGWLVSNIARLADGVPLIIEETIHDLIDDGTLVITSERWELGQASQSSDLLQLPETVEQLFAGRIGRLESTLRTVLEAASVCGRRFWPGLLDALTDEGFGAHELAELVKRGFLTELDELRVGGEGDYAFAQLAIQQLVYRTLGARRRKALHWCVAQWLEKHAWRQLSGVDASIGYHFREAGALEEALPYEIQAAEHAKQMRALESVNEHLGHACRILSELLSTAPDEERLEQAGSLYAQLVHQRVLAGQLQQALDAAADAARLEPPIAPAHASHIALWKGWALERLGRYSDALSSFLEARELLEQVPDSALPELLARTGEAGARAKLGDAETSVAVLREALKATPDQIPGTALADWKAALSTTFRMFANAQLRSGDFDAAESAYQKAYSLADAALAPVLEIEALNGLGALNYYRDQHDQAEATWRSALEIAKTWELLQHQSLLLNNIGELFYARGATREALDALRRAEALHHYLSSDEGLADTCRLIASCLLDLDEIDEASDYGKRSLEVAERVGAPYFIGQSHRILARVAHAKASQRTQHVHHFAAVIRHLTASMKAFEDADLVTEIAATRALREELLGS